MTVSRLTKFQARYHGSAGQCGLALVVVLWVLVLLSLIAASFTRATRTEVNVTRNLVDNAKAIRTPQPAVPGRGSS